MDSISAPGTDSVHRNDTDPAVPTKSPTRRSPRVLGETYDLDEEKIARWKGDRRVNQIREIYFIHGAMTNLVKIGVANSAEQRLSNLRTGCSEELTLLAVVLCPNGGGLEKELHQRFAKQRVRGEWFEMSDELATYIAENETPLELLAIEHDRLAGELGLPQIYRA